MAGVANCPACSSAWACITHAINASVTEAMDKAFMRIWEGAERRPIPLTRDREEH